MGSRFIVGMKDTDTSLDALRWALTKAGQEHAEVVVVHASSVPITVHNGPPRAVAFKMGDPLWATIYSTVNGFAPPAGTSTIVEGGNAADVIAKHAREGDTIVLGPARKRMFRKPETAAHLKSLGHAVRIIDAATAHSLLQGSRPPMKNVEPANAGPQSLMPPERVSSSSAA